MSGVCTNLRLKAMERQLDSSSPGPAAYSSASVSVLLPSSPKVPIGNALRSPRSPGVDGPGPSDYQNQQRMSTVMGEHVEDSRLRGVHGVSIGRGPRSPRAADGGNASPGPGEYSVRVDAFLPSPARQPIGRALRAGLESSAVSPGPAYAPNIEFVKASSPAITIPRSGRPSLSDGVGGPGPGAYSYEAHDVSLSPQAPRQRIGSAPRFSSGATESDGAGPGAYSIASPSRVCGGTIGKSPRSPSASREPLGPGVEYATTEAFDGVRPRSAMGAFGRDGRWHTSVTVASPGPGDFNVAAALNAVRPSSTRAVIGRSSREQSQGDGGAPGPGAYSVVVEAFLPSPHRQPIGRAQRGGLESSAVSPGPAYSPNMEFVKTSMPAYTLPRAGRPNSSSGPPSPGPQDYQSDAMARILVPSSPRTAIGKASRWSAGGDPDATPPGPGAYGSSSINKVFIPGGSIGRSTRPQSAMDGASPGPGAYTVVVNSFLPSSPKQPIGKSPRAMSAKAEGSPGPSDYDSIHALSYVRPQSARATIGRATREQLSPSNVSAEVPLYAPTFDQFVPASPRQPIGRAERWQARPEDATPGAGAYTQPPSPKGPAYTMRAR